jgi:hypothetical protein
LSKLIWGLKRDDAVAKMLQNLLPCLAPKAVVAIVSMKKTNVRSDKYKRLEHFSIGKRKITILSPVIDSF